MAQVLPINMISARLQNLTTFRRSELANDEFLNEDTSDIELFPFIEALQRINAGMFPFSAGDITKVLQAWTGYEIGWWEGGYLVELRDGKRADIMLQAEDNKWDDAVKITVDLHSADFDYRSSAVAENHPALAYGCSDEVQALNDFLETLQSETDGPVTA